MAIIRALLAEHESLRALFGRIEGSLPGVPRLAAVRRLAREMEGLLRDHARAEEDLVLLTLDHVPGRQAWCRAFYRQHQEIDSSLTEALTTGQMQHAKRLLKRAIQHSRRHFDYEERKVFPLLRKWIDQDMRDKFGRLWKKRRHRQVT